MKKVMLFFIFLILIPFAFADWFYNSQNVIVNINIKSDAEIITTTPSGYVESATINLTFFPKQTDTQELIRFYTNPKGELTDKTLKFNWKRPEDKIDFVVDADVKNTNKILRVNEKIDFPLNNIPDEIAIYTKPSETIDSGDEDIIRLASELVKGEDDLYFAVYKIADWTKNNINYNLSTLTADVSQKASWVLENKQGVCDELTSLFIALLRSVGIPARFISGISYTDSSLFPENWGPHGWAEVYFPGYGWVPFDVTYGEFGWIDPTHYKFKDSVDSDEPSTYYQWSGLNADLKTNKLDIKTSLLNRNGYAKTPLSIEASTLRKSIKFGSYNLIEATVKNLNDFYYSNEFYLSKPREVNIIGDELKSVLLLPFETKKIFWILKLDKELDSRYSYTFPLVVSSLNNISAETSFTSSTRDDYVSFEDVEKVAMLLEEEREKKYSGNVAFTCIAAKGEFYQYEDSKLFCEAKNTGNIFLEGLDACFENNCNKFSLGISQLKNFSFEINKSSIGYKEVPATLRNELVSKSFNINYKIKDVPNIEIEGLQFPINVSYNDNFTIYFTLSKKSQSNPGNVDVFLDFNGEQKKWHFDELLKDNKFELSFAARNLAYGENKYKINLEYEDELNKEYSAYKEFSIRLAKANILQRAILWFNKLGSKRSQTLFITIIVDIIIFIVILLVLFKRNREI